MRRQWIFLLLLATLALINGLLLRASWETPAITAPNLFAAVMWIAATVMVTRRQIARALPGSPTMALYHLGTAFTWAAYRVMGPVWGTIITAIGEIVGLNATLGWRRDGVVQAAQLLNPLLPYLLVSLAARYIPVGYGYPLAEVVFAAAGILLVEVLTTLGVMLRRWLWAGEQLRWQVYVARARTVLPFIGTLEWLLGVTIWGLWPLLGVAGLLLVLGLWLVLWRIFALEQEVEEREAEHAKVLRAAATDALTGLFNRHHLEVCLRRPHLAGHPNAVLILDLDALKSINDQLGHPSGDQILRLVAQTIRSQVRQEDICARYGGDEFVVLAHVSDGAAPGLAERIRSSFQRQLEGGALVTLSVGVATIPEDGATGEEALIVADQRLLRAKATGRNRVVGPESRGPQP